MFHLGLKLWSVNENYINEAARLYKKNLYSYIELYVVPNTIENINKWKKLDIPFIIHAPHYDGGMNLSDKNNLNKNLALAAEAFKYAESLNAKWIIFHSGVEGDIQETKRQLLLLNNNKILVENKPQLSIDGSMVCIGHSPEEIKYLKKDTELGFCIDFGHAISSANSKKINAIDYINKFMELQPDMYHLTDGNYNSQVDEHFRYGSGNYPLNKIIKIIPDNSYVTNEAKKASPDNLNDFEEDVLYLKNIVK